MSEGQSDEPFDNPFSEQAGELQPGELQPSEFNPYAPTSNVSPTEAASDVETYRRTYLSHEASVKSIGVLYFLGAIFLIPMGLISFVGAAAGNLVANLMHSGVTKNMIEAVEDGLEPGSSAVIVEDTVTTGGSSLAAIERAEEFGLRVDRVVAIVDRLEGAAEAFAERGYPFASLLTVRDLGIEPEP